MSERRSYSRRQKLTVVGEAEVIGVRPAARKHHVPPSTLEHWRNTPDMARLRTEKREEVAADVWTAFQVGVRRVLELIPQTDDLQKFATATGIIYDKFALLSGEATERTEHRELLADFDDHERGVVADWLREITRQKVADAVTD